MRQYVKRAALLASLAFFLCACAETYTLMPSRTRTAPPPGSGPTAGPPPAAASAGLSDQVRALEMRVQSLENRLNELERTAVSPMAPAPVPERPAAPELTAPPPSRSEYPSSPQVEDKTFKEAMGLFRDKKYEAARRKFNQYLKKTPQGSKAPEARYYLGNSFYQEQHYREAAVEFNKLVNLHPDSVLAPSALLHQALSYSQLKQQHNYQITLNKLVKSYPQSPEAQEARKRLGTTR